MTQYGKLGEISPGVDYLAGFYLASAVVEAAHVIAIDLQLR